MLLNRCVSHFFGWTKPHIPVLYSSFLGQYSSEIDKKWIKRKLSTQAFDICVRFCRLNEFYAPIAASNRGMLLNRCVLHFFGYTKPHIPVLYSSFLGQYSLEIDKKRIKRKLSTQAFAICVRFCRLNEFYAPIAASNRGMLLNRCVSHFFG